MGVNTGLLNSCTFLRGVVEMPEVKMNVTSFKKLHPTEGTKIIMEDNSTIWCLR